MRKCSSQPTIYQLQHLPGTSHVSNRLDHALTSIRSKNAVGEGSGDTEAAEDEEEVHTGAQSSIWRKSPR